MVDQILRSKLIRLASEKPELRAHLLPLLKQAFDAGFLTSKGVKWLESIERKYSVRVHLGGTTAYVTYPVEKVPSLSDYDGEYAGMVPAIERREGMPLAKWLEQRQERAEGAMQKFVHQTSRAIIADIHKVFPDIKVHFDGTRLSFLLPNVLLRKPTQHGYYR